MVATCIYISINHCHSINQIQQTSALQVSVQQCWICFETAAHCGEFELQLSTNNLQNSVCVLFVEICDLIKL